MDKNRILGQIEGASMMISDEHCKHVFIQGMLMGAKFMNANTTNQAIKLLADMNDKLESTAIPYVEDENNVSKVTEKIEAALAEFNKKLTESINETVKSLQDVCNTASA